MVKIEVQVKDNDNDTCNVTIKKPKSMKDASETEERTANVIKNLIDNTIKNISNN